jgi:tRNA 2-thiouridine synthesizing protein A
MRSTQRLQIDSKRVKECILSDHCLTGEAGSLSEDDEILDSQGLYCPEPIMMLHAKMDELESGAILRLIASDPATKRDVPKFCQFLGHELITATETDGVFQYQIRKC